MKDRELKTDRRDRQTNRQLDKENKRQCVPGSLSGPMMRLASESLFLPQMGLFGPKVSPA
jgi:hypothetical protein